MDELPSRNGAHYTVSRNELYKRYEKVRKTTLNEYIDRWENPFFEDTFPSMRDIEYLDTFDRGYLSMKRPIRKYYDDTLEKYRNTRYHLHDDGDVPINNNVTSATVPRLYNVVTSNQVANAFAYHLNKDTRLIIKVIDLGGIYRQHTKNFMLGNMLLDEVYNEVRVGFFLNELLFAYQDVVTPHFMVVLDWFVSDTNLYPSIDGHGPFQYIVSEKLDTPMYTHLINNHDMLTLKCTLWGIAQPLEAAWATHQYIHYDLHHENVMMKDVVPGSHFYDKNYLYTRVYSGNTYLLPQAGIHNTLVKLLDYGRNRMKIPGEPESDDQRDLFEHIDGDTIDSFQHHHNGAILSYQDAQHGIGDANNRTWDMRRIMWALATEFPIDYWGIIQKDSPIDFNMLTNQMSQLIGLDQINALEYPSSIDITSLFLKSPHFSKKITIRDILFSTVREMYINLVYRDVAYASLHTNQERDTYRAAVGRQYGFYDLKILDKRLNDYREWYDIVINGIVYSSIKTQYNATTFLSSLFFESLIVKEEGEIDYSNTTWAGKRPSHEPLAEQETY